MEQRVAHWGVLKKPHPLVADGSALTWLPNNSTDYVNVWYEGNMYGACNVHSVKDKALVAAGRMFDNYPTVARMGVPAEEFNSLIETCGTITDNYEFEINADAHETIQACQALYELRINK